MKNISHFLIEKTFYFFGLLVQNNKRFCSNKANPGAEDMRALTRKKGEAVFSILIFGLTLFVLLLAYFKVAIGVSGEWSWGYCENRAWGRLMGPGFFLVLYLVVVFRGLKHFSRMRRAGKAAVLSALVILAFCLQVTGPYLSEYGAAETVITMFLPHATGAYFFEAQKLKDPKTYMQGFAERISGLDWDWEEFPGTKVKVHPPGNTLLIYSFIKFAQAHPRASARFNHLLFRIYPHYKTIYHGGLSGLGEATCVGLFLAAFFFYLVGSITLIPAYFLAKEVSNKETAFLAAGFVGLMPSILMFSPAPDQIFPLLALLYSFFLVKAIRSRGVLYALLAGLTLSLWSFFHPAFLVMMAFTVFALVIYFFWLPGRRKRLKEHYRPTLTIAAALAAGFLVPNLLLFLLHYNAFRVFWICLSENRKIYIATGFFPRTYWKWALLAIPDFFLFMGIPAACIFLWALPSAWRSLTREKRLEIASLSPLALMVTLFLIAVWGQNKGEIARLLMFLGPIGVVLGLAISRNRALLSRRTLLIALLLLAAQLILFRLFFDVWYSQDLIRRGEFG